MTNLIVSTLANNNTRTQFVAAKNPDTNKEKQQPKISNTGKIIGGLSALAILGTGIYFVVKRGKVLSGNKFKTIVQEDGSMERLFPNGNRVNIRNVQNDNGGWSKTVTVTDSNGKKISQRHKYYYPGSDKTTFEIETWRGYNSEENPSISTLKTIKKYKDKTEIRNSETYCNEKGYGCDENIIKTKFETKTIDKQGKTISENTENRVRNNFGTFDEVRHNIEYKKDGTISTTNGTVKYLEENLRRDARTTKTVDANGNILYDFEQDTFTDKNLNMLKDLFRIDSYKIDADGKRVLDSSSLIKSKGFEDDYTHHYSKHLEKGTFKIRDYVRDENGVGTIVQYRENLDGSVIPNSRMQKSGADVSYETCLE